VDVPPSRAERGTDPRLSQHDDDLSGRVMNHKLEYERPEKEAAYRQLIELVPDDPRRTPRSTESQLRLDLGQTERRRLPLFLLRDSGVSAPVSSGDSVSHAYPAGSSAGSGPVPVISSSWRPVSGAKQERKSRSGGEEARRRWTESSSSWESDSRGRRHSRRSTCSSA
jgi:hypothetical protein